MIITVGGIKGGSGKTTVATNLAIWLLQQSSDILLVDTDPQQTATEFTICREETRRAAGAGYSGIRLTGQSVSREVLKLKNKFDHIVIDSGGADTPSQRSAMLVCDIFLVPVNPRSFDIWPMPNVLELVMQARSARLTDFLAYCFINRADARGSDNAETANALRELEGIEFIEHSLGNRKAFSNASSIGLSVIEQSDIKAKEEINALFSKIFNNSKNDKNKKAGQKTSRST